MFDLHIGSFPEKMHWLILKLHHLHLEKGYTFFEAGKNVSILFHGKGWKTLLTDGLADNLLFIIKLAVACLTGVAGTVCSNHDDIYDLLLPMYYHPIAAGFW